MKVKRAALNVNTAVEDDGWQRGKPHQAPSAMSHERLHHHDNQGAQPQQPRHTAVHAAVWQSAPSSNNSSKSEEQLLNTSGSIISLAVAVFLLVLVTIRLLPRENFLLHS